MTQSKFHKFWLSNRNPITMNKPEEIHASQLCRVEIELKSRQRKQVLQIHGLEEGEIIDNFLS